MHRVYFGSLPTSSIKLCSLPFFWLISSRCSYLCDYFCLRIGFLFERRSAFRFALLLIHLGCRNTASNTPGSCSGLKRTRLVRRFRSMATIQIMWFDHIYFLLLTDYSFFFVLYSVQLAILIRSFFLFSFIQRFLGSTRKPCSEPTNTVCRSFSFARRQPFTLYIAWDVISFLQFWCSDDDQESSRLIELI